jgi:hypothetical protein
VITDIHTLDQYIGRYVDLTENGEGMAGFLVDVCDEVDYIPHPVRSVTLDYGYGFRVSADTVIATPDPPEGLTSPRTENPVALVHGILDGRPCSDAGCANRGRALNSVRAMRVWRMRQTMAYWQHLYVSRARAFRDDPVSLSDVRREAVHEGAPQEIIDHIDSIALRANKARGGAT